MFVLWFCVVFLICIFLAVCAKKRHETAIENPQMIAKPSADASAGDIIAWSICNEIDHWKRESYTIVHKPSEMSIWVASPITVGIWSLPTVHHFWTRAMVFTSRERRAIYRAAMWHTRVSPLKKTNDLREAAVLALQIRVPESTDEYTFSE